MNFISTRGAAPPASFQDMMSASLAPDGGLYVPETWPQLNGADLAALSGKPFAEIAFIVLRALTGAALPDSLLRKACADAAATFHHEATCPLVQIEPHLFVLELFHGPTLAFKDVALQLMAHILAQLPRQRLFLGATSGDTGSAAIAALKNVPGADLVILFPKGRISPVQQRQMTTSGAAHVHPIAIEGTFDDAQAIVKTLLADRALATNRTTSAVNSISWLRIAAQVSYYVMAAVALGAPHRAVAFSVPTGNFGNCFAGYVAKRMGVPVDALIIGSNSNDLLPRCWQTGRYEPGTVQPTSSPSMDIQISSNFERLVFELAGRDANTVTAAQNTLARTGAYALDAAAHEAFRQYFSAHMISEEEVRATQRHVWERSSLLLDPHSAIGVAAAQRTLSSGPVIALATAHPAKFPDAVKSATGITPPVPARLQDLMNRQERYVTLPATVAAVRDYIESKVR